MSAPYRHTCGAVIDAHTAFEAGFYVIRFSAPTERQAIDRCPQCGESLARALRYGDLVEHDTGRRTHPHHLRGTA